MKHIEFRIDTTPRRLLVVMAALILAVALLYIGKWGFANMAAERVDRPDVAEMIESWAPNDPQSHFALAVLYDRTFLPQDQARSLEEYERSVALAPENYLLWLEYGKALSRSGETTKAEAALRQANALAPNYSVVKWTLGNTLVRDGKPDEGFAEIRQAIAGDPTYAAPAVAIAYSYFQGDLASVRNVVGESSAANASLSLALAKDHRYDDAATVWRSIPPAERNDALTDIQRSLTSEFLSAKKFGLALEVSSNSGGTDPKPGQIYDGGFEDAIKLDNPSEFQWQLTPGSQPQVLQSTRQPHGGAKSLVLLFNSNDGGALRQLSQTVVVQPNGKYVFQGWYHSDLKSSSQLVWQIVNGSTGTPIAEIPIKDPSADWRQFSVRFNVPGDADAVIIRLTISGCGSAVCPISGSIWFDDLGLSA